MKRVLRLFTVTLMICASQLTTYSQSVGLVLSGGGAKGIAHIGVIKALEENNIPIDFVTGTSMGAIVGGLYAIGYSPEEMMELLKSKDFANWSTGTIDDSYTNYFVVPQPTPTMMHINLWRNDSTTKISSPLFQNSLINPLPMNFAFMDLFAPYTAQCRGDFNRLFIPFRCVGSNVYAKHKVVFSDGDLGDAIRASMSFPFVFTPIKINGVTMYDGGIYDNFPVDVMTTDFSPSFTLGIDVSNGDTSDDNDTGIIGEMEAMIIQPQSHSVPDDLGMRIHIDLHEFSLLDFPKCEEIYKIGYNKAMEYIDSIKSRVPRNVPQQSVALRRAVFKSQTPLLEFQSVNVSGGTESQDHYVEYIFKRRAPSDTLTIENARKSYYGAISTDKIQNLLPHATYDSSTRMFDLNMDLEVKHPLSIGAGGYITSSTNSMIYLNTKYCTLSKNSLDANLSGWIGQSYYGMQADAKLALRTPFQSSLGIQAVIARDKFYESEVLFYQDRMPSFVLKYDYFTKLNYAIRINRLSKLSIGAGYGYFRDKFYTSPNVDFSQTKQDETRHRLGQVFIAAESNLLNYLNYPTTGHRWNISGAAILGDAKYMPQSAKSDGYNSTRWLQVDMSGEKYWALHEHFTLGVKGEVLASSRKLLSDYTASIVQAPAFAPTPSTLNYFNTAFRANSFAAAGIIPIYNIMPALQLRSEFYAFAPFRKIESVADGAPRYGKWFGSHEWIGEVAVVYSFPFASLSIYGNYLSYPKKNWNFGISFGILLPANKFL